MSSTWQASNQSQASGEQPRAKKLRHACNSCHRAKVKCSRGNPCAGCAASGDRCIYSESNRAGRPRGTKNKRTLDLMNANVANTNAKSNNDRHERSKTPPHHPRTSTMSSGLSTPALMSGLQTPGISPEMVNNLSFRDSSDAFWTFGGYEDFQTDGLLDSSTSMNTSTSHLFSNGQVPGHDFDKDPLGLFGQTGLSADYFSLPLTPSSSPASPDPSKCNCLLSHAKLLCRLKMLWEASTPPPIDVVLDGVKQAMDPWKQFIQCQICQPDEGQEALLLSTLSFRVVLRLLQRVCAHGDNRNFDHCSNSISPETPQPQSQQAQPWSMAGNGMGLRVGNYDITGDEQNLVLDLLVSQTLGKIQFALECLKERSTLRSQRRPSLPPGSFDIQMNDGEGTRVVDYVLQMLGSLESTVQLLHRGLKSKTLMQMERYGDGLAKLSETMAV